MSVCAVRLMFGCDPTLSCSEDCILIRQEYDFVFEIWEEAVRQTKAVLYERGRLRVIEAGDLGFIGRDGIFVGDQTWEKARADSGLALDYFRNYQPDERTNAVTYFHKVHDVQPSTLLFCKDIANLHAQQLLETYVKKTKDRDGVMVLGDGTRHASCWNDHWFVAPACRDNLSDCVPVISGGAGWGLHQAMLGAAFHHLPFAFAVAINYTSYIDLPHKHDVLFYWWETDVTMIDLSPTLISWPPNKVLPSVSSTRLTKLASARTPAIAPSALQLAKDMVFEQEHIVDVLSMLKKDRNATESTVACAWLRNNRHVWKKWVPDPSHCPLGQGLVDGDGVSIDSWQGGAMCSRCSPGRFSFTKSGSQQHFCRECPRGHFSNVVAAVECLACPVGRFGNQTGLTSCKPCPVATFRNISGATSCETCQESFSTAFTSAEKEGDCVCGAGRYFDVTKSRCVPCPQTGVHCPGGRSQRGSGVDMTVLIEAGFMTLPEEPLSVFTCIGGTVSCENRRSPFPVINGTPLLMCGRGFAMSPQCSLCESGWYRSRDGGHCHQCDQSALITIFSFTGGFAFLLLIMLVLYFRFNRDPTVGGKIVSSFLSFLQILQTVLQIPLDWPRTLAPFSYILSGMNAEGFWAAWRFRTACVVGASFEHRLMIHNLTPLTPIFYFGLFAAVAKLFRRQLRWAWVANVCGLIFANLFNYISGITLALFTADLMPNGMLMIKDYPEVGMLSSRWLRWAPVSAAACCLYCGGFFSYVLQFVLTAPRRTSENPRYLSQYRFIVGISRPECWWWIIVRLCNYFAMRLVQTFSSDVYVCIYLSILVMSVTVAIQVKVMPFKFVVANAVDVFLTLSILWMLILATAFINQSKIGFLQEARRAWSMVIMALLSASAMFVCFHMFHWLRKMIVSPVHKSTRQISTAFRCRDVMAELQLLPEKIFVARISRLEEVDLQVMTRCTDMLVSVLLEKQPGAALSQQRLIPQAKFSVWDPAETRRKVLNAVLDGSAEKVQRENARIRSNLLLAAELVHDLGQREAKLGTLQSRADLAFAYLRHMDSVDSQVGVASVTHKRAILSLTRSTNTERRISAALSWQPWLRLGLDAFTERLLGCTDLRREEIQEMFETMNVNGDGFVALQDFLALLPGESQGTVGKRARGDMIHDFIRRIRACLCRRFTTGAPGGPEPPTVLDLTSDIVRTVPRSHDCNLFRKAEEAAVDDVSLDVSQSDDVLDEGSRPVWDDAATRVCL
eukprot:TRINITY_DN67739_c0_g1_i1.p1 TRINITY_DN67739_c0_g1~~TRINITY_DN67739_c0_g1_i1.p1  ORF type:complete len:1367 (+),score=108.22 TRINITY_DN67739_c0_g1_i1:380-4102(+)